MSKELNTITCCACGVEFGLIPKYEENWRRTSKTFYCPNGHGQSWPKEAETAEQKELKHLRSEVKDLKSKLEDALKNVEDQKKKIAELENELEIWASRKPDENILV